MMRSIPVTPVLLLTNCDANLDIPYSEHQDSSSARIESSQ